MTLKKKYNPLVKRGFDFFKKTISWFNITDKPATYPPGAHTHDKITDGTHEARITGDGTYMTGDVTIAGNFTVEGEHVIQKVKETVTEDNIIALNAGEIGTGIQQGFAGVETDRGSSDPFRIVFYEQTENFRVGQFSYKLTVADTSNFQQFEEIAGETSQSKARIARIVGADLFLKNVTGQFEATETIQGKDSLATTVVDAVTVDDYTQAVATRPDSSQLTDSHLALWDGPKNQLKFTAPADFNLSNFNNDLSHNSFTINGSNEGYHLSISTYNALMDSNAQLTALHTDGSPQFKRLIVNDSLTNGIAIGVGISSDLNDDVVIGRYALSSNSGSHNIAIGNLALRNNTTGLRNTAIGDRCFYLNDTGYRNVGIGSQVGYNLTTNVQNTLIGNEVLFNATAVENTTVVGRSGAVKDKDYNDITEINNSVLIGAFTHPNADNETNEIIIGYEAVGKGSNTATIGNDNITATYLKGDVYSNIYKMATETWVGSNYIPTSAIASYGSKNIITDAERTKLQNLIESNNNVKGNWQEEDATQDDYILGKPFVDIVTGFVMDIGQV